MTEQHSHLDIVPGEEAKLAVEEKPLKDYALIAVSAGDGLNQIFPISASITSSAAADDEPCDRRFFDSHRKGSRPKRLHPSQ